MHFIAHFSLKLHFALFIITHYLCHLTNAFVAEEAYLSCCPTLCCRTWSSVCEERRDNAEYKLNKSVMSNVGTTMMTNCTPCIMVLSYYLLMVCNMHLSFSPFVSRSTTLLASNNLSALFVFIYQINISTDQ